MRGWGRKERRIVSVCAKIPFAVVATVLVFEPDVLHELDRICVCEPRVDESQGRFGSTR